MDRGARGSRRSKPISTTLLKNNEHGVTLIEVMMAIALLTISLLAIESGQIQAINMNKESRTTLLATAATEDMIERIRNNKVNVLNYNGFDTDAANGGVNLANIDPVADADFFQFQASVQGIAPGVGQNQLPGSCPLPVVGGLVSLLVPDLTRACGSILIANAAFNGVDSGTALTVVVNVAWPSGNAGQTNGLVMRTTVMPN